MAMIHCIGLLGLQLGCLLLFRRDCRSGETLWVLYGLSRHWYAYGSAVGDGAGLKSKDIDEVIGSEELRWILLYFLVPRTSF
jgi:hypothetical protein